MTRKMTVSYGVLLFVTMLVIGITTVQASEITGSLSSDTSNSSPRTGRIDGAVSSISGSSGGGSSSGGSRRTSDNFPNPPSGSLLAASDSVTKTPAFPNAGVPPDEALNKSTPSH